MHTYRAQDMMAFDNPHWIGGVGFIGGRAGLDAVKSADLLLMLGTDYPYSEWLPQGGNVIQIDERAFVLGRRAKVELGIVGSVRLGLRMLLDQLEPRSDDTFFSKTNAARAAWNKMLDEKADPARSKDKIHPQAVARAISDAAADDAVFVVDCGLVTLWAANWMRPRGRQRITGTFNNQSVGMGLGIANGVQALDRDRQVILQIGDGGFTMLLGEFMTAVGHKLPVKVVVYDNAGWGLVRMEMETAGNPVAAGANLPNMDFAAFARACGVQGFTARDPSTLVETIQEFLATSGPAILHAVTDPAELPVESHLDVGLAANFVKAKAKKLFASPAPGV